MFEDRLGGLDFRQTVNCLLTYADTDETFCGHKAGSALYYHEIPVDWNARSRQAPAPDRRIGKRRPSGIRPESLPVLFIYLNGFVKLGMARWRSGGYFFGFCRCQCGDIAELLHNPESAFLYPLEAVAALHDKRNPAPADRLGDMF